MTTLQLKRAYDPAETTDGYRVYIDRLWPRGLSHDTFHYDRWDKEIAPSDQLREWFHADPDTRWPEFAEKYGAELRASEAFAQLAASLASHPKATLLYSSYDHLHNNAVIVLHTLLETHPSEFRTAS